MIVVLNIVSPVAGKTMASLSVVVILGIKNPLVVLLTSSIALVSGRLPVELIETFCENKSGSAGAKDFSTVGVRGPGRA